MGGRRCVPSQRLRYGVVRVSAPSRRLRQPPSGSSPPRPRRAFSAHGSVEQVYVTGLAPSAQMSLLRSNGETVSTQTADSLGGLLFRDVAPGRRYRVRLTSTREESGPITVHTQAAAPWDPSIYKQSIPDSGYTYLTTRDGTQLAIDVHPPGIPAGVSGSALGLSAPGAPQRLATRRRFQR